MNMDNTENKEKMENTNQMTQDTIIMIQNTRFVSQNALFVNQMTQNILFFDVHDDGWKN